MATIELRAPKVAVVRTSTPSLHALPRIQGASLGVASFAIGGAGDLGGDFCDTTSLGDERWLFAVGDMEGKGPAAALAAVECRRILHDSAESGAAPHEIIALLNGVLAHADRPEASRPCAVCVVSVRACPGGFAGRVCSGGSPLPVIVRADGSLDTLGGPGGVAGYFPENTWNDWAFDLGPGDALIIFTDGLPDSRSQGRFFGELRLESAARRLASRHPGDGQAIAAGLVAEARRFALPRQPPDDMLVLALSIPHAAATS